MAREEQNREITMIINESDFGIVVNSIYQISGANALFEKVWSDFPAKANMLGAFPAFPSFD